MARIIAWEVISLDGFFEGDHPWDLRHHESIWGDDLRDVSLRIGAEAGLLVFGRKTYDGMVQYWPTDTTEPAIAHYMNTMPKLVASRTMTSASWQNTEVTDDIVTELLRRRDNQERPIFIFGSATLVRFLLDVGLIDELMIGLAPIVLGSGNPLFPSPQAKRALSLVDAQVIDTGGVVLRYAVT
jgi:dihydrofolate reductase